MQSPDVNVLVNACRQDAVHHDRCRAWLDSAVSRREPVGVSELVLSGALRILTHPRIFHPATSVASAAAFVDSVLAQPSVTPLRPGIRPLADLSRVDCQPSPERQPDF